MFLYYRKRAQDPAPSVLAERGLSPDDGESVRLWRSLEVLPAGAGPVLVVDRRALPSNGQDPDAQCIRVPGVPAEALRNAAPYRPPREVSAGGGYVACSLPDDVVLLVIFRRGVWDLPKGTKDSAETIEDCARREVREEVGIETLEILDSLGSTQHAYPDGDHYAVKTTHWYLMQTLERAFEPDHREGIERVACARWPVAREHMGYETLRRHMDRVEDDVRTALND